MNSRYVHNVGDVGNNINDEVSKTIPREISKDLDAIMS